MPRTMLMGITNEDRAVAGSESTATFDLEVIDGPDAGMRTRIDAASSRCLVGQSPFCSIRLSDAMVSRRHAQIELSGRRLRLLDLDSTNGTLVNGVFVREVFLVGNEIVRIGRSRIEVTRREARVAERPKTTSFGRLIGRSSAMRKLFGSLEQLATVPGVVLIEGEAGVGKALLAEELHRFSPQREHTFMSITGADAKGQPTADARLAWEITRTRQGTLYIDDVATIGPASQDALVRRLRREPEATRRLILGTKLDLDSEVTGGRFREDLLQLLAANRVELPPLRDREGDVALLAERFWSELGGAGELPDDFVARYADHSWPGNLDEVKTAVSKRIAEAAAKTEAEADGKDEASEASSPDVIAEILRADLPFARAKRTVLSEFERRYVTRALAMHNGNVNHAAAASGLADRSFQVILERQRL